MKTEFIYNNKAFYSNDMGVYLKREISSKDNLAEIPHLNINNDIIYEFDWNVLIDNRKGETTYTFIVLLETEHRYITYNPKYSQFEYLDKNGNGIEYIIDNTKINLSIIDNI